MRLTDSFEKLSDPSMDSGSLSECVICGASLWDRFERFACFQSHPNHEGDDDLCPDTCDVCIDCRKAGVASFPDRLRKRAQQLEQRVPVLRQLSKAQFVPLGEYCVVYRSCF